MSLPQPLALIDQTFYKRFKFKTANQIPRYRETVICVTSNFVRSMTFTINRPLGLHFSTNHKVMSELVLQNNQNIDSRQQTILALQWQTFSKGWFVAGEGGCHLVDGERSADFSQYSFLLPEPAIFLLGLHLNVIQWAQCRWPRVLGEAVQFCWTKF